MKLKIIIVFTIVVLSLNNSFSQTSKHDTTMATKSKTVVFIHGLFVNTKSWNEWKLYFEAQGYTVYTPAYPFHEGDPKDLRKSINPKLGDLTFAEVNQHLINFIDSLLEKPILIGHSMGGLFVQKLISMDKGVMGICIDAAAPAGVTTFKGSFLASNLPVVNPLKGNSVFDPSVKWFHKAFCHTLSIHEAEQIFKKLVVPESRNILRSSTKSEGKIDFTKAHKPLLFVAGELDRIIPSSLNQKNAKAYKDKSSITDFKEFSGRTHYICGQDKWQEVADYVLNWIAQN